MVDYTDPRWNESDSQNTSPSPNGISTGSAPSAVPAVIRAGMGAQVRSFDRINPRGLLTNTGNAYSLTYDVGPLSYEKEFFSFFVNATNTGPATLNINGLGSRDLIQNDGSALKAGDLVAGMVITATYDGSKFRIVNATANPSFASGTIAGGKIWAASNDGAGSTLDADLLDAKEGVWYQDRANHTGTQDVATISGLQAVLDAIVPAGTYIDFAGATAPAGYLVADGSAKSRTTYARLFGVIGTVYGAGDGSTTFNLPDMRGEFRRGLDGGRGVDTGRTLGSAQASQNLAHTHTITDPGHAHSVYDPGHGHSISGYGDIEMGTQDVGNRRHVRGTGAMYTNAAATGIGIYAAVTGITIASNGGTEARPRNVSALVCIKF
ncbi:phage tail protein [Rhizobium sp. 2MFCol3.1]|uniref:phage tail protein n=1 Tax=Rhizobium sp. 2MFCol3.1 TaxID=1246459 RepID=UPI00039B5E90|nr:phage tail protein [Rhizobium sp. 2MFCol3.1]